MELLDDFVFVAVQLLNQFVVLLAWKREMSINTREQLQNDFDSQVAKRQVPCSDAVAFDALEL